jgi:hypothetical protein
MAPGAHPRSKRFGANPNIRCCGVLATPNLHVVIETYL